MEAPAPLAVLRDIVGEPHVLTAPDVVASYVREWTGRWTGHTDAVVRPASTKEVSAVVAACYRTGTALVPQGGNTGLVGGGVPSQGAIVLSLRRLDTLGEVDQLSGQLTAGAGATIGDVQRQASAAGWGYGVDLGSRDSATVGGTVATNAGGLRMVRYGPTRSQLAGVEAVLGDGSVVSHLGGLWKDNTGYDLAGLLCGSEGTLGVVTAARLKLVTPAAERTVALLAFDDIAVAVEGAAGLRRWVPLLEAVEIFLSPGLRLVCQALGLQAPFAGEHAAYVLVEAVGDTDPTDALAAAVASVGAVKDVALASSGERRAALWRYREGHTEAIASLGPQHKLDVSVPLGNLAELAARAPQVVAEVAPKASIWMFGHVADGSLHINVTGVPGDDDSVDAAVLGLVASLGGSISAEHGIGRAKRPWLALNRSVAEIGAMRAVKTALDPAGILNPGVIF
ncbi:MAG: FAD-binding oxidoreductase [Acidimicrobiales bacterium]